MGRSTARGPFKCCLGLLYRIGHHFSCQGVWLFYRGTSRRGLGLVCALCSWCSRGYRKARHLQVVLRRIMGHVCLAWDVFRIEFGRERDVYTICCGRFCCLSPSVAFGSNIMGSRCRCLRLLGLGFLMGLPFIFLIFL